MRAEDCKNQLENKNMKVNEDNGKSMGILHGWFCKVWRFSSNKLGKNIGCLVSDLNFGLGFIGCGRRKSHKR